MFISTPRSEVFGLASLLAFSLACGPAGHQAKLKVIATVFPLFEFAQAVGGDRTETVLLVPAGADVHSWQPRLGDIKALSGDAGLFLSVGPDLEPWAGRLFANASGRGWKSLEASRGLDLIEDEGDEEHGHGSSGADPHVWLDFGQDLMIIDRIAAALAEIEPGEAATFTANAEAYKKKLRELDRRYAEALRPCRHRRLLLGGHAAFAYLARRYGLVQTAVAGPSPDAAPNVREFARIISLAKAENVRTVFYEPGSGSRLARVLAAELGAETKLLEPGHNLSSGSARKTSFLGLMDRNLENLLDGLGCR
ncbi:MAG: zinc ABC transporter substrate-binding protein [Candidatus Aminicenantes bacterium]|nr:zinc ABC transporter substrate-binding protein [Candidatus Aminicenantes bacterium]